MNNWVNYAVIGFFVLVLSGFVIAVSLYEDVEVNGYDLLNVGTITGEEGLILDSCVNVLGSFDVEGVSTFYEQTFHGGDIVPVGDGVINAGVDGNAFGNVRAFNLQLYDYSTNTFKTCQLWGQTLRCQ